MAIAGRVAIVPKGDYDKNASYKRLDCVKYLNVMYVAKKDVPIGTAITDESYWMKGVEGGGSSVIDDTQSSTLTTYSSNKINEFISDVGNSISDINASLGDKINTTGDVSEAVVSTLDEIPNTRLIPSVGDKIKVMFAKTIKYFQDLKTIAFTGDYEDLLNKPSIPTVTNNLLATESGTALDAVQGKAINDKIGTTDISGIGNGTVTGALSTLNSNLKSYYKSIYSGKKMTYKGIVFKVGTDFYINILLPEPLGNFTTGEIFSCIAIGINKITITGEYVKDENGCAVIVSSEDSFVQNNLSTGQICSIVANFVWE